MMSEMIYDTKTEEIKKRLDKLEEEMKTGMLFE